MKGELKNKYRQTDQLTNSRFEENFSGTKKTRPDTRPLPDADGWAGAEMHVFALSQL